MLVYFADPHRYIIRGPRRVDFSWFCAQKHDGLP